MADLINQVIKGYELRQRIGSGGFGAVYRAFQPAVGREVAIKVILAEHANQPEFIRRFEAEAQMVARLEHPYIVPLYDYWREPDGAYLVMRWLRGGSLRASLHSGGPWQPEAASLMLDQITAALTTAHRNGVIHRDLKPDNILLDDEGNAYLADFGIAKDLVSGEGTRSGSMIIGSPDYMAPEQIKGEEVTPQTDIYGLGIVIYETLTGTRPFPDMTPVALMTKQLNDPLPPVSMKRPDLPEEVDAVIEKATRKDPKERYADAISVAVAFRQAIGLERAVNITDAIMSRQDVTVGDTTATVVPSFTPGGPSRNPFKGLRAFQAADAADFFGRDALIEQLMARMAQDNEVGRFLAVVGPSGSGKSSVVKAGLIPRLRAGELEGSDQWFIVEMTPGARPFEELELALLRIAVNPPASLMEQLQADERGLLRAVNRVLPTQDSTLLLVIDQFEEVFTQLESEPVRQQFLNSLFNAIVESRGNLRVIMTLRADFYDRPLLYADFGHLFRRCTEVVLPLNRQELQDAIVKPAHQAGLGLEPGLVEAIIKDVGEQPGALPLLQYALTELYSRRRGNLLTLDAYREINGAMGALARRAEQIYSELDETCHRAARQIFLRLVTLGEGAEDTRRRVRQDELMSLGADANAISMVLDTYGKYRLLTFDRDPVTRVPTVEVAHEALIRSWDRLKQWLNTSREAMRMQRALALAAEDWRRNGRDAGYLMTGTRLDQFQEWADSTDIALAQDERAFLDASIQERRRLNKMEEERKAREALIARRAQNFGRAAAVLAVVGLLALIATGLAFVQANNAQSQVATATVAQGNALNDVATSVAQAGTAQAQVAVVGETLTPVPLTLTPVQLTVQAGNAQIATATVAQGIALNEGATAAANAQAANQTLTPVPLTMTAVGLALQAGAADLETAAAAQGEAERMAATAQAQVQQVGQTLTPVAPTLTSVGATLQAGASELATAAAAQLEAESLAVTAQTQAAEVAALLTPVPVTLTSVAAEIAEGETRAEALRLVSQGNALLQGSDGNVEMAAMLGIRALNIDYSPLADAVLNGALSQLFTRQIYGDHSQTIWYAAISPDSRIVATASNDSMLRLWDAETGMLLRTIRAGGVIWSIVFSADGRSFLTGSADGTAQLWEVESGRLIRTFSGHGAGVYGVSFSPDGTRIATSSADGTARVWDIASGRELVQMVGHTGIVYSAVYSPDGSLIATGGRDTSVRLWDAETGALIYEMNGHTNSIYAVAFSPDGRLLVSGGDDDTARLWEVASGNELRQLTGHTSGILYVAFAPNGRYVATVSRDRTARMWDIDRRTEVRRFSGHTDSIWSVNFSHDGASIVTASSDGTARLWDASLSSVPRWFLGHEGEVLSVAASPDGQYIATGSDDSTVRLWNRETNAELLRITHPNWVRNVAFSRDSRLLASACDDGVVRIWDVATGVELQHFSVQPEVVYMVAFAPDGRSLVAGYAGGAVRRWDVATGELLWESSATSDSISSVAYAPDGSTIATGGADNFARVWDAETGELKVILSGHTGTIYAISYSPDSRLILTGSSDNSIRQWDVRTGEQTLRYTGHTGTVWTSVFSPDSQYVMSSSSDNSVRLWDARTGVELRRFTGHTGTIWSAAFSPDGQYIFSASRDGTVRVWDMDYHNTIAYACSRLRRDFTGVEREQFGIRDMNPTCPQFAPAGVALVLTPTITPALTMPVWTPVPEFETKVADAAALDELVRATNPLAQRVYGPSGGLLFHDPTTTTVVQHFAPVNVRDFIAQARFYNPYAAAAGNWDYAFFFRQNAAGHYRLILDSGRNWALIRFDAISGELSNALVSGTLDNFDTSEGGSNVIRIVAQADKTAVFVNDQFVTTLDVPDQRGAGQVSVVTSAYTGYAQRGAATRYDDFTIWSLDARAAAQPTATWTPIPVYATAAAFSGTATQLAPTQIAESRATAEAQIAGASPVFGPLSGMLFHDADSPNVIQQVATVQLRDFVMEATVYNPYGRTRGDWDFAFFFRSNELGQYRLVISSDQDWALLTTINNEQTSVSGQVTNLDLSEGGSNTLRLVVENDRGAFYLNGDFISALDLSQNLRAGALSLVTGAYTGYSVTGEATRFENFTVYALATARMTPTATPANTRIAQRGTNAGNLPIGGRDLWTYSARGGEIVEIETQAEWDTTLILHAPDGRLLALNDDSARGGFTSLIERFTFPVDGDYAIEVRSYADQEGGAYTLLIGDPPVATPTPIPTATVPPAGEATFGDNEGELPVGGTQIWTFQGTAGQTLTLQTIADWDTVLRVRRANGLLISENDDSRLGGRASLIENLTLPATEIYTIEVGSYNDQFGGTYILRISEG